MILRTIGFAAAFSVAVVPSFPPPAPPTPTSTSTSTPTPTPTTVPETMTAAAAPVSIIVDGQGNGHGRGLSQWGAYGSAVNRRWDWQRILGHYYYGTVAGTAPTTTSARVRLMALDGARIVGVISTTATARWNGVGYRALLASESAPNVYDIYGSSRQQCPSATTGWVLLSRGVRGPITFTTPGNQSSTPAGNVLGVCQPNGSVIHYRGSITAVNDAAGANRVVNTVLVENYLRGVVSREVSSSWGNAGNGAGMHALAAMATAARTFVLSQNRYPYAQTCDTSACQRYGGAAYRATPTAPTSHPTVRVCETGNLTFECATTNRAIANTVGRIRRWPDGRVVSTEYSASHGPRSAGGTFPPVDDSASDVGPTLNPFYRWSRTISAAAIATRYGLGTLTAAQTERDPATIYDGVWGNRVRLTGTARTVVVSAWDFRNAYGLPSPGFTIRR